MLVETQKDRDDIKEQLGAMRDCMDKKIETRGALGEKFTGD
jgi:hypothetical protein